VSLRRTKKNWDDLAKLDTYWAILGYSDLRSGKWDEREFFRTGKREIDEVMTRQPSLAIQMVGNVRLTLDAVLAD
jgi:hypothetical protein